MVGHIYIYPLNMVKSIVEINGKTWGHKINRRKEDGNINT